MPELHPTERPAWGRPHCVLLAEDDNELRSLLALTLSNAGLEVVEARDGAALLDCLAEAVASNGLVQRYDAIVSDIRMPGFTGLAMLAGSRRILQQTPVVLMTAFGDSRIHELAGSLGAAAFFDKPFDPDDLCDTVLELIAGRQNAD